jgi:hypothetical protein
MVGFGRPRLPLLTTDPKYFVAPAKPGNESWMFPVRRSVADGS